MIFKKKPALLKEGMKILIELHGEVLAGIYSVEVLKVVKDEYLLLTMPKKNKMVVPVSVNARLHCFFFKNETVYDFYSVVIERGKEPVFYIKITYPSKIKQGSRRKYKRVTCSVPVKMRMLPIPNDDWQDQMGLFLDMSAGGGLILTKYPFKENDNLELIIQFPNKVEKKVIALVKRVIEKRGQYMVGVNFITLDESERKKFYDYLK